MIKAIISDLNGVFIQSPRLSDRFEREFGVAKEKFMPVLQEIMVKVRKPNAGDAFAYWKPYFKSWGISLTKEHFFYFWFSAEKEVPELIELAKEIKQKGIKIFILSNNFVERADYYKDNFTFIKVFDKVYYSWQTGFVKPDSRAFSNLLSENGLRPDECLYFDNSKENVESAQHLGIKSFVFSDAATLKEMLNKKPRLTYVNLKLK